MDPKAIAITEPLQDRASPSDVFLWAAPFLLLGVYNKLVKVAGHDQHHPDAVGPENQEDKPDLA